MSLDCSLLIGSSGSSSLDCSLLIGSSGSPSQDCLLVIGSSGSSSLDCLLLIGSSGSSSLDCLLLIGFFWFLVSGLFIIDWLLLVPLTFIYYLYFRLFFELKFLK